MKGNEKLSSITNCYAQQRRKGEGRGKGREKEERRKRKSKEKKKGERDGREKVKRRNIQNDEGDPKIEANAKKKENKK